jgi:hypothetical protein
LKTSTRRSIYTSKPFATEEPAPNQLAPPPWLGQQLFALLVLSRSVLLSPKPRSRDYSLQPSQYGAQQYSRQHTILATKSHHVRIALSPNHPTNTSRHALVVTPSLVILFFGGPILLTLHLLVPLLCGPSSSPILTVFDFATWPPFIFWLLILVEMFAFARNFLEILAVGALWHNIVEAGKCWWKGGKTSRLPPRGILVAALVYVVGRIIRTKLIGALLGQGTCLVAGAGIGGATLPTEWFVRRAMGHVARFAGRQSAVGVVLGEKSKRTSTKGLVCGERARVQLQRYILGRTTTMIMLSWQLTLGRYLVALRYKTIDFELSGLVLLQHVH